MKKLIHVFNIIFIVLSTLAVAVFVLGTGIQTNPYSTLFLIFLVILYIFLAVKLERIFVAIDNVDDCVSMIKMMSGIFSAICLYIGFLLYGPEFGVKDVWEFCYNMVTNKMDSKLENFSILGKLVTAAMLFSTATAVNEYYEYILKSISRKHLNL